MKEEQVNHYIEADAAEIRGSILGLTDWEKALRITRSVERQQGSRTTSPEREKCTADEFAKMINVRGWGKNVIARHLDAWEKAADDGHVPHAADLAPGQAISPLPDPDLWSDYYPPGDTNLQRAKPDERAVYERAAQETGTTAGTVARIAASPQGVAGAIIASPQARRSAEDALRKVRDQEERDAATRFAGREPTPDPDDRELTALLDAETVLRRANTALTEAARLLRDVPFGDEGIHQRIARQVDLIKIKADGMYSLVHDGEGFDAELRTLLDDSTTEKE